MFLGVNASGANRNATRDTVQLTLFPSMLCTWRILGNGVALGVGQDLMCVRLILAVLSLTVCAEFGPTDFTEFGDSCCITLITAKHILGTVLRVLYVTAVCDLW